MTTELAAEHVLARHIAVGDRMQYFWYPEGREAVKEQTVVRTVEGYDDDGVWCVFVHLDDEHRLLLLPYERVVVFRPA